MELPPPPPLSAVPTTQLGSSDSVESSPRSHNTDSLDEPFSSLPSAKLRLMCSYGGHIVPRPHLKSLCYLGGHTRIVVVDRHSSLAELSTRLSRCLLNDRSFTLKYQLPNEDLDSLISLTTDEDLENMIEEYDRTSISSLKPSRLRLFLFPSKPESASSMGSLFDKSKSDTWFVDALNGVEAQTESLVSNKQVKHGQDVHSVPDSMMLETTSSFGSSSSSPSLSNLPPIRVHVEDGGVRLQDQKVGLEENFSQMGVAASADSQKQDEGFAVATATVVSAGVSENPIRDFSNDERLEQGVLNGLPKPPPPHLQQKPSVGLDSPSPDSVASDNSISNAISAPKSVFYQDPTVQAASLYNRVSPNPIDPRSNISDPPSQIKMQQVQDSGCILPPQFNQQFIHAGPHYIHHHSTGPVPISSYYPMYPRPQHQLDQQYPIYLLPVRQTQPYNLSTQSNLGDTAAMASSRPPTPHNLAMIPPSAVYKEPPAPMYPTMAAPLPKPELAASIYRTATSTAPPLVHVPSTQHQPQYVVFPQMHHPSQSIAAASATDPQHAQIYYTQPPAAALPPQS